MVIVPFLLGDVQHIPLKSSNALGTDPQVFTSLRTPHVLRRALPENFEETPEYKAFARQGGTCTGSTVFSADVCCI